MARQLRVEIIGDPSSFSKALDQASSSASGFGSKLSSMGALAAKGVVALGVAATGAAVVGSKAFNAYNQTMQQTVGLAGVSQKQVDAWSKQLLTLGPKVAKSPQELAEALYQVASSGAPLSKAMSIVTASAKASAAGLGETAGVADAVTSVMNAYGASNESASKAVDTLIATVKDGKGEAADFAPVIGNVASVASQMGVSFNDVGAALASMTQLGTDAQTSATELTAIFSGLLKTTPGASKELAKVGLSAQGLREELRDKGLLATLQSVSTAFDGNTSAMAKAFPNIRALRGLLALTGSNAKNVAKVFDDLNHSSGSLDSAFAAAAKGGQFRWNQLVSGTKALTIQFGALISPLVTQLEGLAINGIGAVQDALGKLSAAQGFHAKLDVVLGTAENLAGSIQSKLAAAVSAVDWGAVWSSAKGMAAGLQTSIENVDWATVGAAIGNNFAAAVQKAITATKGLPTAIKQTFDSIDWNSLGRTMGPGLAAAVVSAFATLTDPGFWIKNWDLALAIGLTVFGGSVGKIAGRLGETLTRLLGPSFERGVLAIAEMLERVSPRLGEAVLNGLIRLPGLVTSLLSKLLSPVKAIFDKLGGLAKFTVKVLGLDVAIQEIANFVQKAVDWFKSLPGKIEKALPAAAMAALLFAPGAAVIDGLIAGVKSKIPDVLGILSDLADKVKHAFTSALGIHSPSTVFAGYGSDTVQGFINGLEMRYKDAQKSLKGFGSSLAISADIMQAAHLIGLNQAEAVAAGFVQGTPSIEQQIRQGLAQAIQQARQVIQQSRQTLGQDFQSLAQSVLSAFDDKMAAWKPPALKLLDKMQLQDQVSQAKQAIKDAQDQLAKDRADLATAMNAVATAAPQDGESPQDFATRLAGLKSDAATAQAQVVADQKAVGDAKRAQTELNLQLEAQQQQAGHDATEARQRESLARQLLTLQTELAKHPNEWKKESDAVVALLKKYDVPMYAAGQRFASQFSDGLKSQLEAVNKAAAALASAVSDHLVTHSPAKRGPLSVMSPQEMGARIGGGFNAGLAGALYRGQGLVGYAPAAVEAAGAGGLGQTAARPAPVVNVTVNGVVGDARQVAVTIRDALVSLGQSEGGNLLGGYA